jgi:uncharacterized membrane protein HdeD (DUF308 family)
MKLPLKICLTNIGLAISFSFLFSIKGAGSHTHFTFDWYMSGWVFLVGGFVDLLISIVVVMFNKNKVAAGFLLSAVALILIGSIINHTAS